MPFGRRRFRRRGFARPRSSSRGKTEKNWLDRDYLELVTRNAQLNVSGLEFIDFFALVEEAEYTNADATVTARQDEGAVLRTLGRLTIDLPVDGEFSAGQAGLLWSAAIIRNGSEDLENAFINDPSDLDIWDPERRARMDILQWWPNRFLFTTIAASGSGTLYWSNNQDYIDFDVRLARRLRTDQEVYMVVRAVASPVWSADPLQYGLYLQARTLLSER